MQTTIYENSKHPVLNIYKNSETQLEGSGVIANSVGCGFLVKSDGINHSGPKVEYFLDSNLIKAMYAMMLEEERIEKLQDLRRTFSIINKDEEADGEEPVPFSDVDFYADQIFALKDNEGTPITMEEATKMAKEMSELPE